MTINISNRDLGLSLFFQLPRVFVNGKYVGGMLAVAGMARNGTLRKLMKVQYPHPSVIYYDD